MPVIDGDAAAVVDAADVDEVGVVGELGTETRTVRPVPGPLQPFERGRGDVGGVAGGWSAVVVVDGAVDRVVDMAGTSVSRIND